MQKAFDTADHIILLYKLDYYEIRGVCYVMSGSSGFKWLVSINGYNCDLIPISCGVPQGSVLGQSVFLIYTNDLHKAIEHCKVHHFADDINLFIKTSQWKI